ERWEQFAAQSGEQTGFTRCGLLYLSNNEQELEGWARWGEFARTVNVQTQMLNAEQAAERGRATGKPWKGGVFAPTDGIADPSRAAPAVARAIMALGSSVHQNCAVRGVETEGGRLSAVVTEKGTIRTRLAVLAAGAWASSFCRQYGIRFPQATIRQTVLSVSAPSQEIPSAL
ncbi:D-amino acid oxidase, partial [Pseudomonas syringae pv. syringae FF5]